MKLARIICLFKGHVLDESSWKKQRVAGWGHTRFSAYARCGRCGHVCWHSAAVDHQSSRNLGDDLEVAATLCTANVRLDMEGVRTPAVKATRVIRR